MWPENTLVAYQNVFERWPEAILEGDAQRTADGHVVLMHDSTVDRTTNGQGKPSDFTLDELKALDAGYHFTPDGGKTFPYRGQGVTIPTLDEALDTFPDSRFLIEMKPSEGIAEFVVKIIQEHDALDRVIVAAFTPGAMRIGRELEPRLLTCFDFIDGRHMLQALREGDWAAYTPPAVMLAADPEMLEKLEVTPGEMAAIRRKGVLIQIHTINDRAQMDALFDMGVDGLLSDRPELLAEVIAERNEQMQKTGTFIEAEAFAEKVAPNEDFAVPIEERGTSQGRALYRFFTEGHVAYHFAVSNPGVYTGWLRYAANGDVSLPVALDPADTPEFTGMPMGNTGDLTGAGAWDWDVLFRAELEVGDHVLALGSAPLRPDCLLITPEKGRPTDALIAFEKPVVQYPPDVQSRLDKPIEAVRPAWLEGATDYRLPAWFDGCRVQAHTRLGLPWLDKPEFLSAGASFKAMDADVFTRHIKSGKEGAWWPSAVGASIPEAKGRNLAREIVEEAHKAGCRILVYHRHMEDALAAVDHPDWLCRDANGEPSVAGRGEYMCFNSPYREYLLTRLLELVDMGADGFYFDEMHMPKKGCWCDHCRAKFKESCGLDLPPCADEKDPLWHKLVDFKNQAIEQAFVEWRRAIHARHPECVVLIGSNTWPALSDRTMTGRLFRIADSVKTEFELAARPPAYKALPEGMLPFDKDAKMTLGYVLSRDAADGRPAHVWTNGLLDDTAALYATAGILTYGCIANLDVAEADLPGPVFARAFDLGKKVSPYWLGTAPVRWAAIHYSEVARDAYAVYPEKAWDHILYPLYAAYRAFQSARLPVGVVTDSQLEEGLLDGYEVLFLPESEALTDPMKRAVEQFEARGGLVVVQRPEWQWHKSQAAQDRATAALIEAVSAKRGAAVFRVTGGPERVHIGGFQKPGRLIIALANEFAWVYTGKRLGRDGQPRPEPSQPAPPSVCRDVKIVLADKIECARALEAVSGRRLVPAPSADGLEIVVPDFDHMAVVVVES